VQESNLPLLANYTPYFDSPVYVSNESFSQSLGSNGAEFLAETGRMDGWELYINYEGDPGLEIAPLRLYSNVSLFKTIEGAQLAITKYSDRHATEYGFTEEFHPPAKIGDVTRVFYKRVQETPGGNQYSLEYIIDFSYRNVFQTVQESGLDRNVDPIFLMDIAQRLLAKLQASPLINP